MASNMFLASSDGSHGSLVLGGYDERRMVRNDVVFPFEKDKLRLRVAWVENIKLDGQGLAQGNKSFGLSQPTTSAA
jgi:hypothetical protein